MRKVLVVSYYFPPLNNIAAKRFGTMCEYFEEYGYQTVILTSNSHGNCFINTKLDLKIPGKIHEIVRIGRTGAAYVPESVFFQALVQWLEKHNRHTRTLSEIPLGWYEKVKRELNLSKLKDIDIIIGTYPSMDNLFVANYISGKLSCPFVADIRDLITEYSDDAENKKRSFLLDSLVEKYILRKASGIVSVTNGFGKILGKKYPDKRCKVIFNGWEKKECLAQTESDVPYLYYAGALYSHRLESFELLLDCMKEVLKKKEIKMKIRSVGPKELDGKMGKIIRDCGMEKYVELLEAAEERVIKKEQSSAYINVVLSSLHEGDKALMATVPGKVYEVLVENAPVLAIAPETSDTAYIIRKTNKGIATISKERIVDFILHTNKNFVGNSHIEFFSRKNQAKRYCEFLDTFFNNEVRKK